jgi:hypothetical protein
MNISKDGQTITLQVNETFLLKLGEEYDWNITIDDQTIVSPNVLVVRGAPKTSGFRLFFAVLALMIAMFVGRRQSYS